jgi:uncharacterized protein YndB with AHSA1/START domain
MNVTVTRTIKAPPEAVYDVWLDPTNPGGPWFGAAKQIIDVHVDGLFYHVADHQGRKWTHYGRFTKLERGRMIEYTWMSEATHGIETTVAIALRAVAGGTELALVHRDLPDDDAGRGHEPGWTFIAEAVAKRLER